MRDRPNADSTIPDDDGDAERWRRLYEGTRASLEDMTANQAKALEAHRRLRKRIILALKRSFPDKFTAAERDLGTRMSDTSDEVIAAYLDAFLTQATGSLIPAGVTVDTSLLRAELRRAGFPVPDSDDLNAWAETVARTPVNGVGDTGANTDLPAEPATPTTRVTDPFSEPTVFTDEPYEPPPADGYVGDDGGWDDAPPDLFDDPRLDAHPPAPVSLDDLFADDATSADGPPTSNGGPDPLDDLFTDNGAADPLDDLFADAAPTQPSAGTGGIASRVPLEADPLDDLFTDNGPEDPAPTVVEPVAQVAPPVPFGPMTRPSAKKGRKKEPRTHDVRAARPDETGFDTPTDSARIEARVDVPNPVFRSDLVDLVGGDAVDAWEKAIRDLQPASPVKFINSKGRHAERGPLVFPAPERRDALPGYIESTWGQCITTYRGRVLYELGVLLHACGADLLDATFGQSAAVLRVKHHRGTVGIVVAISRDSSPAAAADLLDAVAELGAERLALVAVVAVGAEARTAATSALTGAGARLGSPSCPVVIDEVWSWVGNDGRSAQLAQL